MKADASCVAATLPQGRARPRRDPRALSEALAENPRLVEMPTEEVDRQLVLGGYLQDEPSPPLVAEALQVIEAEQGNPT